QVRLHRDCRPAVPLRGTATSLRLPIPVRLDRRQQRLVPQERVDPRQVLRQLAQLLRQQLVPETLHLAALQPQHPDLLRSPETTSFPGKLWGSGRTAEGRQAATASPGSKGAASKSSYFPKQRLRPADDVFPGEVARCRSSSS